MARVSAYVYKSRHNVFYFRLRVPLDLLDLTSQKDIRRSLKTHDRKRACMTATRWLERCEEVFTEARSGNHLSLNNIQLNSTTSSSECQLMIGAKDNVCVKSRLLSEVAKELATLLEEDGVSQSVIDGKLAVVRLLVEIIGDLPIDQYTRQLCRRYKDVAL